MSYVGPRFRNFKCAFVAPLTYDMNHEVLAGKVGSLLRAKARVVATAKAWAGLVELTISSHCWQNFSAPSGVSTLACFESIRPTRKGVRWVGFGGHTRACAFFAPS